MTSTPPRRRQRGWVVLSALLMALAFLPYDRLGGWVEAWLPAALVLCAPAPYLAAMACGGGFRRTLLFAAVWWMLGSVWLLDFDPEFGPFAWLAAVGVGTGLTFALGLALAVIRQRRGAAFMLAWSPVVWTGWEVLRTWTPAGLPWFAPAHAFWKLPVFYQIAEYTGYFGLSLPIAVVNAGFARLLLGDRGGRRELAWTGAGRCGWAWCRRTSRWRRRSPARPMSCSSGTWR
ncbi:MAG: hypothetical protein HYU66_23485 [Armatimonadetes bacterium]|nr:hypothetical protein [Armatimonadota bacterium]